MSQAKGVRFDGDSKLRWLTVVIPIAFASGFLLSWHLWLSSRIFPASPVAHFLPSIPHPLYTIWLFLMLGLLTAIAFVGRSQRLILTFLLLAGLLSLWDQTRWQPWFYQFFLMLAAIGVYGWKKPEGQYQSAVLNICRLIVAMTYVWSGLQKLNATFVLETWPDMAGPLLRVLPKLASRTPPALILIIPTLEVLTGIGLITLRFRNYAVVAAIATHAVVLTLLISSGENQVVWPWNIAMVLFVWILFWRDKATLAREILRPRNGLHAVVLLLVAILPVLSFADLWDSYLSAALYSGNTDQAVIVVSPAVVDRLPAEMHDDIWTKSKPFFLDINRWSYSELHVPVYPEPRVYRRVAEEICKYGDNSPEIKLLIKEKPDILTGQRRSEYYDCEHLSFVSSEP